mgnify:CR=1 FL=1
MAVTAQPSVTALMRPGRRRVLVDSHVTPTVAFTRAPDWSRPARHGNGLKERPVPDPIRDLVVARAAEAPDHVRGGQGPDGAVKGKHRWGRMSREIAAALDGDARFPDAGTLAGRMMRDGVYATMILPGAARQRGARSGCRRPHDSARRPDAGIRYGPAESASGGLSWARAGAAGPQRSDADHRRATAFERRLIRLHQGDLGRLFAGEAAGAAPEDVHAFARWPMSVRGVAPGPPRSLPGTDRRAMMDGPRPAGYALFSRPGADPGWDFDAAPAVCAAPGTGGGRWRWASSIRGSAG